MTATKTPAAAVKLPRPPAFWRHWTLLRHLFWSALGLLALYLVSISLDPFGNLQLAQICYTTIATAGLTVLSGLSGQISLGHGAFVAVGAYTTALLLGHGWSMPLAMIASVVLTALVGALVGVAAARLRGPYLAGATLALAVGLPSLADYHGLREVLGGANGLTITPSPPPEALGESFPLERWQAWIGGICLVLVLFLLANLVRSPAGRAMRLVREDEDAAALSGVHVARTQVLAFWVSAGCAGLGGSLFAMVNGLASPGAFTLTLSLSLLTAAVLGGLGSLAGAVYGSVLVTLLPNWSANVSQAAGLSQDIYANVPLVLYGVVLIVVILLFPGGIQSGVRALGRALRRLLHIG